MLTSCTTPAMLCRYAAPWCSAAGAAGSYAARSLFGTRLLQAASTKPIEAVQICDNIQLSLHRAGACMRMPLWTLCSQEQGVQCLCQYLQHVAEKLARDGLRQPCAGRQHRPARHKLQRQQRPVPRRVLCRQRSRSSVGSDASIP